MQRDLGKPETALVPVEMVVNHDVNSANGGLRRSSRVGGDLRGYENTSRT